MASLDPGNIIHKVVNGYLEIAGICYRQRRIIRAFIVVEVAEKHLILGLIPDLAEALPRISVTEVVH